MSQDFPLPMTAQNSHPHRYEVIDQDTGGKYIVLAKRPLSDAEIRQTLNMVTLRDGAVPRGQEWKIYSAK